MVREISMSDPKVLFQLLDANFLPTGVKRQVAPFEEHLRALTSREIVRGTCAFVLAGHQGPEHRSTRLMRRLHQTRRLAASPTLKKGAKKSRWQKVVFEPKTRFAVTFGRALRAGAHRFAR
jgi:hypothetical protein